ncbi:PREDICTED: cyclin-dependent kinase inhibitor 1-like [Nelumbo nucifera]|uniref:Cyclin-dependent kinase inhibitor domain-containing protein n=2 Tax=Nelumbo nucifera TaxID=4432 RepID=A0A822XPH5_NELNU|nr:PREDICTED: cyclin-dependent kinase inhibitor 1-like [Nelumbo nucifera]DAD22330.1 TPA_asm: hypothetical protein HUJ06_023793 [Nelumbo nucifera]
MGKYMRKCKGIGDVAVMEVAHAQVGVKTRARTLAMAAASASTAKRRKVVASGELHFSSSYLQLRSRRRLVVTQDMPISPATSENSLPVTPADRCSSASSDHVPASRCSSNGSSELLRDNLRSIDLEGELFEIENSTYFDRRERRETTPSSELEAESDDLESTARPSESNFRQRSMAKNMPTEAEIDDFFSASEKLEQKRFADKYNYDIVKDVPLEGRYEWICLKP